MLNLCTTLVLHIYQPTISASQICVEIQAPYSRAFDASHELAPSKLQIMQPDHPRTNTHILTPEQTTTPAPNHPGLHGHDTPATQSITNGQTHTAK